MLLFDHGEKVFGEDQTVARPQAPRALRKRAPCAAAEVAVERDLDHRLAAPAGQPRRNHLGVVEDEKIARTQQCRQIRDPPVFEPSRCRDHQQPRRIARLARMQRNPLARQVKIEIVDVHSHRAGNGVPTRLSSTESTGRRGFCYDFEVKLGTSEIRMAHRLTRREFGIAAGAATLAGCGLGRNARAADTKTLRFIAQSDLRVLDPIWTTAYITRNHGYMVFDTLFAIDAEFAPHPQMVGDHSISPDKLTYQFKLRDGLRFNDGSPVRGIDCVASVKRWMARDGHGQTLATVLDEIRPDGEKGFRIKLKEPFSLLLDGIGKVSSLALFVMPERLANT